MVAVVMAYIFGHSYTVNIVGGVPQKVATNKDARDSPTQSPSGLLRRKHFMRRMGANRRISCKDLGGGDCQGWLWKRKESSGLMHGKWIKRWFVLKHTNLYYYKSPEDEKAHGVIHLPGFTVSPAPDLKSKKFAFKVFHTGMTFHLASDRQDDMGKWMNKMGLAAIVYDTRKLHTTAGFLKPDKEGTYHQTVDPHHPYYSESDEDGETTGVASGNSSPPTPLRGVSPAPSTISSREERFGDMPEQDELVVRFTNIRRADIGIDGRNAKEKRASSLSKAGELDLKNTKELELHRKVQGLCRSLKQKREELHIVDNLLNVDPMTASALHQFRSDHLDILELLHEDPTQAASRSSDDSLSDSEDL